MKRVLTTITFAFAIATVSAQNLQVGKFQKIDIDGVYSAKITKADTCSVFLDASADMAQNVDIYVKDQELHVTHKAKSFDIKRDSYLRVSICLPYLEEIEVSGTSKVEMAGSFKFTGEEFNVELDGMTSIKGLDIAADKCSVQQNGVSTLQMKGNFTTFECEIGGTSKSEMEVSTKVFECEVGGTAKFSGVKAETADIEMSGTSNGTVEVTKSLTVELSGCSKLTYSGPDNLKISKETNFTSKLEKSEQ